MSNQIPEEERLNTELQSRSASEFGSSDPTGTSSIQSPVGTLPPGTTATLPYDSTEQQVVIETFMKMLWRATRDGGKKRAAGIKPPWWLDEAHEAAIWSHVDKWKHRELKDKDSGAHPLVHLAWRALAIAYQETYGRVDPQNPTRE